MLSSDRKNKISQNQNTEHYFHGIVSEKFLFSPQLILATTFWNKFDESLRGQFSSQLLALTMIAFQH